MAFKLRSSRTRAPRPSLSARIRGNFLTGLVVVLPIALTIYLILAVVGFFDNRILPLLPQAYNPATYGVTIKGFGVVVFIVFTVLVGSLTKGIFGRQLLRYAESLVDRTPIVRSVYNGVKQIIETVLAQNSSSFERACLIEYPRKGIWAIAFIATTTKGEVLEKTGKNDMVSLFLPTTPNPTSGFLLFVPRHDIVLLDMDVEQAAKLIISAGLVTPPTREEIAAGRQLTRSSRTPSS